MNINRGFIVGCVVLLLAVFTVTFTFKPKDYEFELGDIGWSTRAPMGFTLVDEMLKRSAIRGYEVINKRFGELAADSDAANYNYLWVSYFDDLMDHEVHAIDSLLTRGSDVMLFSGSSYELDTLLRYINLDIRYRQDDGHYALFKDALMTKPESRPDCFTRVQWIEPMTTGQHAASVSGLDTATYIINNAFCDKLVLNHYIDLSIDGDTIDNVYHQPRDYTPIVTMTTEVGEMMLMARVTLPGRRGALYLASTPALTTNVAVTTSPAMRNLVFRMFSLIADRPIRRVALEPIAEGQSSSYMHGIWDSPALSDAFALAMLTCLLAMVFTARRRQRVIPVIAPPVNRMKQMIQHVGDFFYRRRDNVSLVMKRYEMFVTDMRRELMLDIEHDSHDLVVNELAAATGIDRTIIATWLADIAAASAADTISDRHMTTLIDHMERITAAITS